MPRHVAEDVPANDNATVFLDILNCSKLDVDVQGIKTQGKSASKQDVDIETIGRGVIIRSPNGHRWRVLISDTGVLSGVDLDA